jgi:hypothetical protein
MKINDIVELLDESQDDWNWEGRMTVIYFMHEGKMALCAHPDMGEGGFDVDSLVIMEETDEPSR